MEFDNTFDELTQKEIIVKRQNVQKEISRYEKKLIQAEKKSQKPGYCVLALSGDSGVGKSFLRNLYPRRGVIIQANAIDRKENAEQPDLEEDLLLQTVIELVNLGYEMRCAKGLLEMLECYTSMFNFATDAFKNNLDFKSKYMPSIIEAAELINPWAKVAIKAVQGIVEGTNSISEKNKLATKINAQIDEFLNSIYNKKSHNSSQKALLKKAVNLDLKLLYVQNTSPILIFLENANVLAQNVLSWLISDGIADNVIWVLINRDKTALNGIQIDANIELCDYSKKELSQYLRERQVDKNISRLIKAQAINQPVLYNPREIHLRTSIYIKTKNFPQTHDEAEESYMNYLYVNANKETKEYLEIMAALGEWNEPLFRYVYKKSTSQDYSSIQFDQIIRANRDILSFSTYDNVSFPAELTDNILQKLEKNYVLKIKINQVCYYEEQQQSGKAPNEEALSRKVDIEAYVLSDQSTAVAATNDLFRIEINEKSSSSHPISSLPMWKALSSLHIFCKQNNINNPEAVALLAKYGFAWRMTGYRDIFSNFLQKSHGDNSNDTN